MHTWELKTYQLPFPSASSPCSVPRRSVLLVPQGGTVPLRDEEGEKGLWASVCFRLTALVLSRVEFRGTYFLLLPVRKTRGGAPFPTMANGSRCLFLLTLPFQKVLLNGQRKRQDKGKNTQILRDGQCSERRRGLNTILMG